MGAAAGDDLDLAAWRSEPLSLTVNVGLIAERLAAARAKAAAWSYRYARGQIRGRDRRRELRDRCRKLEAELEAARDRLAALRAGRSKPTG